MVVMKAGFSLRLPKYTVIRRRRRRVVFCRREKNEVTAFFVESCLLFSVTISVVACLTRRSFVWWIRSSTLTRCGEEQELVPNIISVLPISFFATISRKESGIRTARTCRGYCAGTRFLKLRAFQLASAETTDGIMTPTCAGNTHQLLGLGQLSFCIGKRLPGQPFSSSMLLHRLPSAFLRYPLSHGWTRLAHQRWSRARQALSNQQCFSNQFAS